MCYVCSLCSPGEVRGRAVLYTRLVALHLQELAVLAPVVHELHARVYMIYDGVLKRAGRGEMSEHIVMLQILVDMYHSSSVIVVV